MTFSPDASFPVINIEKGRIGGNFTAEFEPSDRLPKMVSFHSGTKTNVVPERQRHYLRVLTEMRQRLFAKSMEEEAWNPVYGIPPEDGCLKIAATGETAMQWHRGKERMP